MNMESVIEAIRKRLHVRMDAEEEENKPKRKNGGNTRLPYGLCESEGIGTEGMTPREAWEAYYKKTGISPKSAYKAHFKGEKGSGDKDTTESEKTPKKHSFEKVDASNLKEAQAEEKRIEEEIKKRFGDEVNYAKNKAKIGELANEYDLTDEEEKKWVDLLNEQDDLIRKINAHVLGVDVKEHDPKYKAGGNYNSVKEKKEKLKNDIKSYFGDDWKKQMKAEHLAKMGMLSEIGITGDEEKKLVDMLNKYEDCETKTKAHMGISREPYKYFTGDDLKVDSLDQCTNHQGVAKYMYEKYGIDMNENFHQEIKNVDTVKQIASGIEKSIEEFPMLKGVVTSVHPYELDATASYSLGGMNNIGVNASQFNNLDQVIKGCEERKFWPKNTTAESLMIHECTHALEHWMTKKCGKYKSDGDADNAMMQSVIASEVVKRAYKNVYPYGSDISGEIRKISKYGLKSYSEAMAEAFADCYANGGKATMLSKEIKKVAAEMAQRIYKGEPYDVVESDDERPLF